MMLLAVLLAFLPIQDQVQDQVYEPPELPEGIVVTANLNIVSAPYVPYVTEGVEPRTIEIDRPDLTADLPPPPPPPAPVEPVEDVWYALAVCESGWYGEPRWDYNGSSGFDGGLQFHPGTWDAFGGDEFADFAYQATPAQQIAVAERVLDVQGWGAWPSCSSKLGLR